MYKNKSEKYNIYHYSTDDPLCSVSVCETGLSVCTMFLPQYFQ